MVREISVPGPGMEPVPPAVDGHLKHGHPMMPREAPQQNKLGGLWGVPSESSGRVASSGRSLDLSQSAVPSCESKEEGTSVKCRNSTVKCWILRADSVRGFAISLNVRWNAPRRWKLGV